MKTPALLVIPLIFLGLSPITEARTWTSSDGRTLEAEITALEGTEVTLKTAKGEFKLPLDRLSAADQAFAKDWLAKKTAPAATPGAPGGGGDKTVGDFENLKLGEWPSSVSADFELDQIQVVKEDKAANEYIYRSPHFEFHSPLRLSTSVVREFSRIFEATFEFTKVMPIGLGPKPKEGGHYFTQLYADMNGYYNGGGMPGSAGMHVSSSRGGEIIKSEIHVPLTSLGVEYTGARVIVDHKKRSDTLTHEIAHQMTGRWLFLTPVWFKEGLAETVSTQRYDSGRFNLTNMDRAVKEDVTRRSGSDRRFTMVNLDRLMNMSSAEWAAGLGSPGGASMNYPSANVLFYYFLRIEGEGNGANLVNYLKAIASGTPEAQARTEILMGGKSFAQLQEEVAKGWRSQGLQIEFQ